MIANARERVDKHEDESPVLSAERLAASKGLICDRLLGLCRLRNTWTEGHPGSRVLTQMSCRAATCFRGFEQCRGGAGWGRVGVTLQPAHLDGQMDG